MVWRQVSESPKEPGRYLCVVERWDTYHPTDIRISVSIVRWGGGPMNPYGLPRWNVFEDTLSQGDQCATVTHWMPLPLLPNQQDK